MGNIDKSTTQAADQHRGLNQVILVGEFASEPEIRTLPSGSTAASFSLRVRSPGTRTASVPVVWYDPPKRFGSWRVEDTVAIRGAVVRRFYRGSNGLGSSTEVVVTDGELRRHAAKCRKVMDRSFRDVTACLDSPPASTPE